MSENTNDIVLKSLAEWINSEPREVCIAIAARTALRVLPVLIDEFSVRSESEAARNIVLPCMRVCAFIVMAVRYRNKSNLINKHAEKSNLKAMRDASRSVLRTAAYLKKEVSKLPSAIAASTSASAQLLKLNDYVSLAIECITQALNSVILGTGDIAAREDALEAVKMLDSLSEALDMLNGENIAANAWHVSGTSAALSDVLYSVRESNSKSIMDRPLWPENQPIWLPEKWAKLIEKLDAANIHWDVWTRWYICFLQGISTPGGEELDIYRARLDSDEDWKKGPAHVNLLIKAMEDGIAAASSMPIASQGFDDDVAEELVETDFSQGQVPDDAGDMLSQTPGALRFGSGDEGPIDVLIQDGAGRIADTVDARDSYAEVVRFVAELVELYERGGENSNNGNSLAYKEVVLLRAALGQSIRTVRPGLLIPRGEALRQRLASNKSRDDMSDLAPLSDNMERSLGNVVKAYNGFVGLDPELSKRDEASFGPDAEQNLVPPDKGQELAKSARESGVITVDAESAIGEEGKVAPSQPEPANRLSRRFSESTKNLFRATISKAVGFVRWVKVNPGKSVLGGSGAAYLTAQWVLANEQWLVKFFADNPAMLNVLKQLVEFLKTLPMG